MPFLSWSKDYEVGVKQIDHEHRHLFDLINQYHEQHTRQISPSEIAQLLNRLVAYAEEHFKHEEKLMADIDYPLFDEHSERHNNLISAIFSINEGLSIDMVKASAETLEFIKNWLQNHILKDDINIGNYLRQKPHVD